MVTGLLQEALGLLEPMTNDPVNYVRQGVLLASALILVQQNEVTCSKSAHFRQLYAKIISDKHEDVMSKFGAILAQGIIDAGGRNATVSLQSRTGHTNMLAVVGLLVFQQFWYWYPLAHFLSLAFSPTTLIGLNVDLKMPKVEFQSNAKPSQFAYPPMLEEKKDKTKEKIQTAILSTTAKEAKKKAGKKGSETAMEVEEEKEKDTKDKDKNKEKDNEEVKEKDVQEKAEKEQTKEKKSEQMEVDSADAAPSKTEKADTKSESKSDKTDTKPGKTDGDKTETAADEKEKEKEKKKPEPAFQMLDNPARVMRAQLKVLQMPKDARYTPLKEVTVGGVLMMRNSRPDEQEEIVEPVEAGGPKREEEGEEPEPPEPFEWTED